MKICAIICEFNPFHNGHAALIAAAKERTKCDAVLCFMSGAFTQRGEAAVLNKFIRAGHAVSGGADAVISLPPSFSVAPAEIFARGAAKLICSVPAITSVAFGCECGNSYGIERAADILAEENEVFRTLLKKNLDGGESYIRSLNAAFVACGGDDDLLQSPNNILAAEYVKALKALGFKGSFVAVKRVGSRHGDTLLKGDICSSSAIRNDFRAAAGFVPPYVEKDLIFAANAGDGLNRLKMLCLLRDDAADIKRVYGCTEGLENALKKYSHLKYDELIKKVTGRRYASARIERILTANLLKIYADDCENYLKSDLYVRPVAVRRENAGKILSALSEGDYPVVVRGRDAAALSTAAKKCLSDEIFADGVYDFLYGSRTNRFMLLKV